MFYVMKKIFIASFLLLFGCTFVPTEKSNLDEAEVDMTIVPEIPNVLDEYLVVPMEDLPFAVRIPSGWTFFENGDYEMEFDHGGSGSVQFSKTPLDQTMEEFGADALNSIESYDHLGYEAGGYYSLLCKKSPYSDDSRTDCAIKFDELSDVYFAVISDKALDRLKQREAKEILFSLYIDD